MRLLRAPRALYPALFVLAALLGGCDRAADVIPGGGKQTPAATATAGNITVGPRVGPGQTVADAADNDLARAVVQVIPSTDDGKPVRMGTGVVVDSARRLILTSYPVVRPYRADGGPAYTKIRLATNREAGRAPQPEYEAELLVSDQATGLAILRVSRALDGAPNFDLPAVIPGDTAGVTPGTVIRLFGHPGEGAAQNTLTVQRGAVTGQRSEAGQTSRLWLKTAARMPSGAAGGPVFNQAGALIGVMLQEVHNPKAQVGQIRPFHRAENLIDQAQKDTETFRQIAPLYLEGTGGGVARPIGSDGIRVGKISFALSAIDTPAGRDLFDYEQAFKPGIAALYYEYTVEGVPDGTVVEERWFLDNIKQDSVSSSMAWKGGSFGIVNDRIAVPGAGGLPSGRWRVEVWSGNVLRARGVAYVGGRPASEPAAKNFTAGSLASPDGTPAAPPQSGQSQVLGFFDYTGMEGVSLIQWIAFRNKQRVYQSPPIAWDGGDVGKFWIGVRPIDGVASGSWEFEVRADGKIIGMVPARVP
ncbi:MAG: trypsin-like peptidase domain-containing protein [Chloroflexi bacterium]|nr:trypsin-like peptidase domain-containing protein [Chloroflexota bacterium]